ncbi:hypothetical protein HN873_032298 [Arachis hypogaea]
MTACMFPNPYTDLPSTSKPKPNINSDLGPAISRLYYITVKLLNHIQTLATSNSAKPTKLESISTFLWKLVASAAISSETVYVMQKYRNIEEDVVLEGERASRRRVEHDDRGRVELDNKRVRRRR